jgi:hypothetical protein
MGKLKTLDLFAGIGGFTLGLEKTGLYETVAFCEWDKLTLLLVGSLAKTSLMQVRGRVSMENDLDIGNTIGDL